MSLRMRVPYVKVINRSAVEKYLTNALLLTGTSTLFTEFPVTGNGNEIDRICSRVSTWNIDGSRPNSEFNSFTLLAAHTVVSSL